MGRRGVLRPISIKKKGGYAMYRRHYIEHEGNIVLFLPSSLRFFNINEDTKTVIEAICEKEKNEVLSDHGINEETYDSLLSILKETVPYRDTPSNTLIKVTLIISGSCNLKCKYCYANCGKYETNTGNMSKETIKNALDHFLGRYDEIGNIQFFGGEPTMNLEAVRYACEYVHAKYDSKEIKHLPNLGMVTNGTLVTDELIDIVKKYNVNITVSLDGPKEVNDLLRVYPDGSGTSDIVEKNILKLKETCNQPVAIEATYSELHEKMGYSVLDIVKYLKDKFDVPKVHVAPVSSIKDSELAYAERDPFIKSIGEVHEWKKKGCDYRYASYDLTLEGLKYKQIRTHYCEAGLAKFAVSATGDVYPCYLFNDAKETSMGNVNDKNLFESDRFKESQKKLLEFNRFTKEECKTCFNNTLCRQCAAENYFANNDLFEVPKATCNFAKKRTEVIIGNIAKEQMNGQV